ncbi:MAG TPA: ABC transporter permease [Blastocatellia bacterium]|nr:ABC transporter permease [Blastocatellia bacterium]HMV87416.1 ABC transporter permease [Blastocatellia bacterium]HMX25356.1 ABC transporter permease [Blastocatellia bacterium]HMY75448.1 ABC transporter permease [Blastocatellia bacterium]HMZ16651.1 ABC transporter permease [Blastocatellia bacterium]
MKPAIRNPQSAMHYQSSVKIPLWRPAWALVREHHGLIHSMVRRDLTSRYKGSVMGMAWTIITPAVQIVIFTVIFSGIFNAKFGAQGGHLSFAVYLLCGMLPWIAFSDAVLRSTTSLTDNVNLVRRVVFPLEALPVNLAFSALMQQLFGTIVLLAAVLVWQKTLHVTALLMPLLLIPQLLLTIGLGWLMASLGVFIRDMSQVNQLALQTLMYLTPILYPENLIPTNYRWLVDGNPFAPLIRSYRRVLLEGQLPDWRGLAFTLTFALICFGLGYWWFQRTKKAFADLL